MPVYNEEENLEESLSCALSQDLDDFELICIDDGSEDASREILRKYQEDNDNLVVLEQVNEGAGRARNLGLQHAKGEFISFLDSDDLYPGTDVLSTLLAKAREHSVSIAGGSLTSFDEEGNVIDDYSQLEGLEGQTFTEEGLYRYADYQFDYGYQRFIYQKSLLVEHGIEFPHYLRYQDPPFFVKAMIAANTFYAVTTPTYSYRTMARSVDWTQDKTEDMVRGATEVALLALDNDLEDLFALAVNRLDGGLNGILKSLIIEKQQMWALDAIYETKALLSSHPSSFDKEPYLKNMPAAKEAMATAFENAIEVRRLLLELDKAYGELAESYEALRKERDELAASREHFENQLNETLNSKTWKVGRAISWLPRKLKGS